MFRVLEAPACHNANRRLLTDADLPQVYPTQSNLVQQSRKRILETHSSVLLEAALSPVKYALFQVLGTCFLQLAGCPHAPKSYAIAAKTGAFGGITVAIFYFLLVITRNPGLPSEPDDEQALGAERNYHSLWILLHEMIYSALASAVGSVAYSWSGAYRIELGIHAFAGSAGPILCLILFISLVGFVWCVLWSQKKFMDWYTGYL